MVNLSSGLLFCACVSVVVLIAQLDGAGACKPAIFKKKPIEQPTAAEPVEVAPVPVVKEYVPKCQCGMRPSKFPRIAGGEDTEKNEFPWQAALVYRNTRIPFCGGALINSRYILTAAHCVLNLSKILLAGMEDTPTTNQSVFIVDNDFQILLNAYKLDPLTTHTHSRLYKSVLEESWGLSPEDEEEDFDEGTLRIDVAEKIFHHKFIEEYRKLGFDYDIALIRLKTPVDLTQRSSPIPVCLPRTDTLESYENKMAVTIGWGRTNFRDSYSGAPVLQKLKMPVYSLDECYKISGIYVTRRYICAGHKTKSKDIGKSDSGGPLMIFNGSQHTQIGIVSWGAGEIEGHVASAFTRVSEFLSWIDQRIYERERRVLWCSHDAAGKKPNYMHGYFQETTTQGYLDSTTTLMPVEMEDTTYMGLTYF